jgi:hypothetical protein
MVAQLCCIILLYYDYFIKTSHNNVIWSTGSKTLVILIIHERFYMTMRDYNLNVRRYCFSIVNTYSNKNLLNFVLSDILLSFDWCYDFTTYNINRENNY